MTDYKKLREEDLKEAIRNRTEDPDELLDPEDIDVDTSDIKVGWRKLARKSLKEKTNQKIKGNRTDWEYGFDCGQQELMQKILKLIENEIESIESLSDMSKLVNRGRTVALRDFKQKIKGDVE